MSNSTQDFIKQDLSLLFQNYPELEAFDLHLIKDIKQQSALQSQLYKSMNSVTNQDKSFQQKAKEQHLTPEEVKAFLTKNQNWQQDGFNEQQIRETVLKQEFLEQNDYFNAKGFFPSTKQNETIQENINKILDTNQLPVEFETNFEF